MQDRCHQWSTRPDPQTRLVANIVFRCFVLLDLKSGDGRTDNMCENNDPYQSWPWVGLEDQFTNFIRFYHTTYEKPVLTW